MNSLNSPIIAHPFKIISVLEKQRLLGQRALTLWLTGLSGAGKSTLAFAMESELYKQGKASVVLDGDDIRHGLNRDLGFSIKDRSENIRRIAEVAKLMNDAGLIVISSFISPSRDDREMARAIIGKERFFEIYLNTPLNICEQRDAKGLYRRARSGELKEFTGISASYEIPIEPALTIDSSQNEINESVAMVLSAMTEFEC
jgi:adenylyl-sulfate kinase